MNIFKKIASKLFKLNRDEYYLEVVRSWNHTSWCTETKCFTCAHPIFVIKKRNYFKRDEILESFWYTNRIEDALNRLRMYNGHDWMDNEKAYTEYTTEISFDEDHNSGIYVKY